MADGNGSSLTTIAVALIGTAGVIGAALIASGSKNATPPPTNIGVATSKSPSKSITTTTASTIAEMAPRLTAPAPNQVLSGFPRHTVFQWTAVPMARTYRLEVQYCDMSDANCIAYPVQTTSDTTGTVDFIGAQPGRWRVTALDANQQAGRTTAWRFFSYSQ